MLRFILAIGTVIEIAAAAFGQQPCANGQCPTAGRAFVSPQFGVTVPASLPPGVEIRDVVGRGPTLVKVGANGAPDVFLNDVPPTVPNPPQPAREFTTTSAPGPIGDAVEAIDEVNRWRAARRLPPFIHDPTLTVLAKAMASERARILCFGHLPGPMGDYRFVPRDVTVSATGCAAYPPSMGWLSCCQSDTEYRYAGAAYAMGRDGKRYMHLVVRK